MPELSGIANAKLGLLALGFTPEEADKRIPEIEEFCSIGDAIYRPMKTYSSGMGARLRFAISTSARPDILLIDEALSTGDSTFKAKSEDRMSSMLEDAGTIFLVSHSASMIERMCNRAIWMHQGSVLTDGDAKTVSGWYQSWSAAITNGDQKSADAIMEEARATYVPVDLVENHSKPRLAATSNYQPKHALNAG